MTTVEIQSPVVLLEALNTYRAAEGKDPIAAWRAARHQPMLDAYEAQYAVNMDPDAERPENFYAEDQADAAIDENNEAPDSMLVADDGTTISENDFLAQSEELGREHDIAEIAKAEKLPAYKVVANAHGHGHSKVENPVAFIHGFLDANPTMTRKQATVALVQVHGINYSTARTQFQKWFSKNRA